MMRHEKSPKPLKPQRADAQKGLLELRSGTFCGAAPAIRPGLAILYIGPAPLLTEFSNLFQRVDEQHHHNRHCYEYVSGILFFALARAATNIAAAI